MDKVGDKRLATVAARLGDADLPADDEAAFVARAQEDPTWLRARADDAAFHGWLGTIGRVENETAFVARVVASVEADADGRRFLTALWPRLERVARQRRRRHLWPLVGVAAAALLAIVVGRPWQTRTPAPGDRQLPSTVAPLPAPAPTRAPGRPAVLHGAGALAARPVAASLFRYDGQPGPEAARAELRYGTLAPCPPGLVPRCLRAARYQPPHTFGLGVQVTARGPDEPLFRYEPDLYLRFAYWLGETTTTQARLEVEIDDQHREGVTDVVFTPGPAATWNHVWVPLSALRWSVDPTVAPPPGQPVTFLQVILRFSENDVLYVHGLEVVRLQAGERP